MTRPVRLAFILGVILGATLTIAAGRVLASAPRSAVQSASSPASAGSAQRRAERLTGAPITEGLRSDAGVSQVAGNTGRPAQPPGPHFPTVADARAFALRVLGAVEFRCLDRIVWRESRWDPTARNRRSGAYGLPQALHGLTSPDPVVQLRWMIRYLGERYGGSACAAWRHIERQGWY
jgi:hypothetical protein